MPMPRVVVVGAGQAGCQVLTSLCEQGSAGHFTLIGAEPHLPYQRPPLSKGHLTGKAARESLWLRPQAWFAEHDIELLLDHQVIQIDRAAKQVRLGNDSTVPYDILVLALGARNRELAVPGTGLSGVLSLRSLDDADDLRPRLAAARSVAVVGGGFIGMEVAATAAQLGKAATVIELAPQLMGRVLSADTAAFLLTAHRKRGLTIHLDSGVRQILGANGMVTAVETSHGQQIPADLVLIGVGAVPNDELAAEAGLAIDNGVVVDENLRTADPCIFAVGDCASAPNTFATAARVRLESVQNAVSHARRAASRIAGLPNRGVDVPWFWSDQADLKLQIAGLTAGHDQTVLKGEPATERFSTYCFAGGLLVGVESVNRPADHLAARRLLALTTPITLNQVQAADFNAKALTGPVAR